jgi:hypothetical protein
MKAGRKIVMGRFEFARQNKSQALQTQRRKGNRKDAKRGSSRFSFPGLPIWAFPAWLFFAFLASFALNRFKL